MHQRWMPIIGLFCIACGDSKGSPSENDDNDNGAPDSGTPDDNDNTDDVGSGPESCTAVVAQYGASCEPGGYSMADCEDTRVLYVGEGCGDVWSKYASCAAAAAPDCDEGDFPACRQSFSALFQCQSAWAARTRCTRLTGGDSSCPAAAPYSLGCVDEPPSEACVMTEDDTLCCP
jgi:hypothetical protein